ncbi:MAG TPA: YdeI/OmpD-associated family protein [Bryobacteraceae bacterium]|nr:YdeI/OmpD-associated family protein [Bryobacteraceae bacterium]
MSPTFFATPAAFRAWLEENHERASELLVGFYKKDSLEPSITWPESVDQALCFGWIDGVRKRIDDVSYTIRFTPRKSSGIWSAVNIKRAGELSRLGLMRPAGLEAFGRRDEKKSAVYSYEQRNSARFPDALESRFRANKKAWDFFRSQAPSYQRTVTYWVVSAKRDETRLRRLAKLIEDSQQRKRIDLMTRTG